MWIRDSGWCTMYIVHYGVWTMQGCHHMSDILPSCRQFLYGTRYACLLCSWILPRLTLTLQCKRTADARLDLYCRESRRRALGRSAILIGIRYVYLLVEFETLSTKTSWNGNFADCRRRRKRQFMWNMKYKNKGLGGHVIFVRGTLSTYYLVLTS